MKKHLLLLFLSSFFCFQLSSQSGNLLFDFINKNDLILRSVHKQMYYDDSSKDEAAFKRLITAQLISVQLANTDPVKSSQYAYLVRSESVSFMRKNTKSNLDYYTITADENKSLSLVKPKTLEKEILENTLLSSIQSLKVTDMNLFNSFKTSIR